ncbi:hypothetical protein D3C87_746900 [compost metagenome]
MSSKTQNVSNYIQIISKKTEIISSKTQNVSNYIQNTSNHNEFVSGWLVPVIRQINLMFKC